MRGCKPAPDTAPRPDSFYMLPPAVLPYCWRTAQKQFQRRCLPFSPISEPERVTLSLAHRQV